MPIDDLTEDRFAGFRLASPILSIGYVPDDAPRAKYPAVVISPDNKIDWNRTTNLNPEFSLNELRDYMKKNYPEFQIK